MSNPDPIFAAIDAHRAEFARYLGVIKDTRGYMWGTPRHVRYTTAQEVYRAATTVLTETPISTLAGATAFLAYLHLEPKGWPDNEVPLAAMQWWDLAAALEAVGAVLAREVGAADIASIVETEPEKPVRQRKARARRSPTIRLAA